MEKRLNLRFNLSREPDRKAWEYLQSESNRNRKIILAVNAYADRLKESSKEDAFLERIVETVRKELRAAPALLPPTKEDVRENSEDAILDFLDGF